MLTHEQIMNTTMTKIDKAPYSGVVIAQQKGNEGFDVVLNVDSVNPKYYNLLRSAAFLYSVIDQHKIAMEKLSELFEAQGYDAFVPHFLELQGCLAVAQDVAVNGMDDFARRSNIMKKIE